MMSTTLIVTFATATEAATFISRHPTWVVTVHSSPDPGGYVEVTFEVPRDYKETPNA